MKDMYSKKSTKKSKPTRIKITKNKNNELEASISSKSIILAKCIICGNDQFDHSIFNIFLSTADLSEIRNHQIKENDLQMAFFFQKNEFIKFIADCIDRIGDANLLNKMKNLENASYFT